MKSALRAIRHIQGIPALAESDRGEWVERYKNEAKNARISEARHERWRRGYDEARKTLHPDLIPYLLCRQHDAFVVGARREGDRFILTALDEDLSMIVEWKYGLERRENGFPFDIVFQGVTYVGWRSEQDDGELRSVPAPRDFTYTEWGNDTLIEPEAPGIRWALAMHHQHHQRGHYVGSLGQHLILLVEAERMYVVERQRAAWLARFGEDEMELFDRYHAVRAEVSLSHHPERLGDFGIAWP